MATIIKPSYGSATAIACTTTSLATDASLLAGRQSDQVVNTTDLAVDAILGGTIATASTITINTVVEVWLWGSWDGGTTRTCAAGTADANLAPASLGSKALMALVQIIAMSDTTARTYTLGPISVAQAFGGTMPTHWGVYIVQNTGQTLGATALKYTAVQYTNV